MNECDEIAHNSLEDVSWRKFGPGFTYDDVLKHVNEMMGEYGGYTINANIAETMYNRLKWDEKNGK